MMDLLLHDSEAVALARRLRSEDDLSDALARAAWSVITEPGDAVAGVLVRELGAADALRFALGGRLRSAPAIRTREALHALDEGRSRWHPRAELDVVVGALRGASDAGAGLLVPGDSAWPQSLNDLDLNAPLALWVRGDSDVLCAAPRIAVVGARAASGYGERVATDIAGDLAVSGGVIVSGGAYGIDGAAHRAALGVGGRTVAFLAGGIDRLYPAGNQGLLRRIMSEGAVVSEAPFGAAPTKWRFLARNRLIAALGQATVVIEAGWRSGSLNTAGHAATLGRPLGAVPGPVTSASSAGCHRLFREYGAVCVTSAAEVRELYGDELLTPYEADSDRRRVREGLSSRTSRPVDEIARRTGLSPGRIRALLGLLEVEGDVVRSEEGWRNRRMRGGA